MKLSAFACAASLASVAMANTVFVTRLHYITVDANGDIVGSAVSIEEASGTGTANQDDVVVVTVDGSSTSLSYVPTTLLTVSYSSASLEAAKAAADTTTPTTSSSKATSTSSSAAAATSSSSSSSGIYADIASSGVDASFAKEMLDIHNAKRALHSAGELSWDTTVYQYAQAYADKYTCGADLKHSGGKYGENLAVGYADATSAFNAWYGEGDNYDYSTATVLDHFTAIIWKGTTKLGCAYKTCDSGKYIICSYDPAGNIVGYGKENLFAS